MLTKNVSEFYSLGSTCVRISELHVKLAESLNYITFHDVRSNIKFIYSLLLIENGSNSRDRACSCKLPPLMYDGNQKFVFILWSIGGHHSFVLTVGIFIALCDDPALISCYRTNYLPISLHVCNERKQTLHARRVQWTHAVSPDEQTFFISKIAFRRTHHSRMEFPWFTSGNNFAEPCLFE